MVRRYSAFLIVSCLVLFLSACGNVRYLRGDEVYYKGTEIIFPDSLKIPESLSNLDNNLERLSKLQPNKKLLGLYPLKLWLYNMGYRGFDDFLAYAVTQKGTLSLAPLVAKAPPLQVDSRTRKWLTEKVGEAPSLIDSTLIYDTRIRMENYLYNRGYFYPEASSFVQVNEKRKSAVVQYNITPNNLFTIQSVVYEINDSELMRLVLEDTINSPLKPGVRFDLDYLKIERKRIATDLNDNGYFFFNKENVYFEVDSSSAADKLDVYVKVDPPKGDSIYRRYKVRNLYVIPDINASLTDTVFYQEFSRRGVFKATYRILQAEEKYTPRSLVENVFIASGDYYSQRKISQTIGAYSNLNMFKYSTVQNLAVDTGDQFRYLDLFFKLEPMPKHDVSFEFSTSTTSEYLLATYGNASITRLNTFKRLDALQFSVNAGLESQITNRNVALNTSQFNTQVNLTFPRFFWPFSLYTPKSYYPRTISTLKFEYLDRVQFYTLFNTSFKYGSERFEGSRKQQLSLYPIDVNYVRVPRSTAQFDSILENNFLLRQSFQEQLIMAPNLKYVYNTQAVANKRNDIYFRAGVELSGTLTYLGFAATDPTVQLFGNTDVVTDPLKIVGIPFSNYTRFDLDFRDYFDINSSNTIIGRIALGLAIPYWNSQVAPFVKQFYVGGANSIRAYPIRKVGPGSYLSYEITEEGLAVAKPEDQTGGLKLEFNTEYRFDIAGMLEGALFCDVGNVWSLKYDPDRPGSQFQFKDFYRELAVGPGFGLRLDFSYFIIRLDAAYPLVDPAVDGPNGRYYEEELGVVFPAKVLNWNFAIGYPF